MNNNRPVTHLDMKKYYVIFIFIFTQYGIAQTVWNADLPIVDKSDYYNIELSQELVGAGLEYLKIFDEKKTETPYFIRSTDPIQEINSFESFKLERNTTKDSLNIIVVDNQRLENINRFCIVLQKAETEIFAAIRGSNDKGKWFIVKQTSETSRISRQTAENTEMLIIDFPRGEYRFYEIRLWSNNSSPLDIQKVGRIKNTSLYGNFVEVELGNITQENEKDENNTYIRFPDVKHSYCISKIEFYIKNKPDYLRHATLIDSVSYDMERMSLSSVKDNNVFINNFSFSSNTSVVIENRNNPPLAVDSIKIYGLRRYVCLYLEAGKRYNLVSDSSDPISSGYDIEHFKDKISTDLPILQLSNQEFIPEKVAPQRKLSLIEQPVFLWSVILVVGAFLIFVCFRMIRELKKK